MALRSDSHLNGAERWIAAAAIRDGVLSAEWVSVFGIGQHVVDCDIATAGNSGAADASLKSCRQREYGAVCWCGVIPGKSKRRVPPEYAGRVG